MNKRIEELEIALISLKTEFESFKAYHDKIVEHLNQAAESNEAEITRLTKIHGRLSWAKYVAADMVGTICVYRSSPTKGTKMWHSTDLFEDITPDQALSLCGRIPEWSDEEPTPVKQ